MHDEDKECVICGTVYLTEIAACGTSRLVPNISDSTIAVGNIEKNQEVHSAPQVDSSFLCMYWS